MKIYLLLSFLFINQLAISQKIEAAPDDKAVVYFVRKSNYGSFVNFSYFDGDIPLIKHSGRGSLRYVCEPGKHIFWAKAENYDFVDANLEAGKIYIIEVEPFIGLLTPRVHLYAKKIGDPDLNNILKCIDNKRIYTVKKEQQDYLIDKMSSEINNHKTKYKNRNENNWEFATLTPEMYFSLDQLKPISRKELRKQRKAERKKRKEQNKQIEKE
jgi:hypothetical protein